MSSTRPAALAAPSVEARVTRSAQPSAWLLPVAAGAIVLLVFMPSLLSQGDLSTMVNVFILLTMAVMWNLLAGYAGMVSIGQQAFIGLGAEGVLAMAQHGLNPVASIPLAAIATAAIALPVSLLVFRLRGGYFAIATWVVADTAELVVSSISSLGSGTGSPVPGLSGLSAKSFGDITYWSALAVALIALAMAYLVLRSRLGLVLAAVRDDEVGARSAGARVMRARRIVFAVAALGCGAAGALLAVSQLNVQPSSVFSVQWSAEMIFVTLIGGIGTLEGPIIGTILFFVLEQSLAQHGALYLIVLGAVAVVVAIWAPKGIWGMIASRARFRLFPVGYWLWTHGATRGRKARRLPARLVGRGRGGQGQPSA
ncbi:MAG TPA: branched-chain amino acid ABC transporter permease [Acidimicrobiales bacterium]|nr:branched-chain amino acid ABC transporter permease [Acidimicrobiales bacterium]